MMRNWPCWGLCLAFSALAGAARPKPGPVCTQDRPTLFVKMKEGASAKATEMGLVPSTYAGKIDGDVETQIAAVESCIAGGAKGILITPSDSRALAPVVGKAREAGVLVIALDTPFEPADAADATFATDNFLAGELIGKWAAAKMGDTSAAKIALLDLNASEISVDYLRDNGFLKGFGVDIKDPKDIGDEDDARIVGNDVTNGNEEGGRTAMENLLQKDSGINVVYTINEPAAAGAYEALKAVGLKPGADRLGRWRLPGRAERQGGRDRRHLDAIPASDGLQGHRGDRRLCQGRHEAGEFRRARFRQHRGDAGHRQPDRGIPSITSEEALKQCWG
uniref:Potential D-ribose-binding periplasmic protein n=1 Tax=Rhodobacter capsulatus TaxID=1061 RepID=O68119_RHOCA|nr:potential D-ribose-binding periplasmic protein precursor [Rhodobacter capsulatus SB 1003]